MQWALISDHTYLLRLEAQEEIMQTIQSFCEKEGIHNALLSGLGSVENPTLAHYRVSNKKYSEKQLEGVFELTNLTGNIAIFDNKPLIHAHVTISDEQMQAFGGHLVKSLVSATVELTIIKLETALEKQLDDEIGLKLWKLPNKSS